MTNESRTLWLTHQDGSHLGAIIDRLDNLPNSGMVELQLENHTVQVFHLGNSSDHIADGNIIGVVPRDPASPDAPITLVEFTYDVSDRWSYRFIEY